MDAAANLRAGSVRLPEFESLRPYSPGAVEDQASAPDSIEPNHRNHPIQITMLAEYRTKTNIGVGIGFVLQLAGRFLLMANKDLAIIALILTVVGAVVFIWGCMNYTMGKGYSKWLGLLGLLSCIGLIVLVVLPDRNK